MSFRSWRRWWRIHKLFPRAVRIWVATRYGRSNNLGMRCCPDHCADLDFVSSVKSPWVEFRCPACKRPHWVPF